MKKYLYLLLATSLLSSATAQEESITIATDKSYPPWHDLNENGELVGYEVDLAKEMCKEAKLKCEFKIQSFSTLIQSVRFNKYDILMAGLANNKDRQRVIDFSIAYAESGNAMAYNEKNEVMKNFCQKCPKKLDLDKPAQHKIFIDALVNELKGKKIGFERNSTGHRFFEDTPELKKNLKVYIGRDVKDLVEKLSTNEVDAVFNMSSGAVKKYAPKGVKINFTETKVNGGYFGYGASVGLRKTDVKLKAKINAALRKIIDDGRLQKMKDKWFEKKKDGS